MNADKTRFYGALISAYLWLFIVIMDVRVRMRGATGVAVAVGVDQVGALEQFLVAQDLGGRGFGY
jgi:hypothetical protein